MLYLPNKSYICYSDVGEVLVVCIALVIKK